MSHHSSFPCSNQCFHLTTDYFLALGTSPLDSLQLPSQFQKWCPKPKQDFSRSSTRADWKERPPQLLPVVSEGWISSWACFPYSELPQCSQLCLWCPYDLVTILSLPCLNFPIIWKEKLLYFTSYLTAQNLWVRGTNKVSGKSIHSQANLELSRSKKGEQETL